MAGMAVVVVFFFLVVLTIFLGVRIVPQGSKHVVQRLGKFHKTLGPGLNIIIPYIDTVAHKVTTKDIVLDIPSQEVITRDNAVIIANAVAYINIVSPEKSVYGVENYDHRHSKPGADVPALHRGGNGSGRRTFLPGSPSRPSSRAAISDDIADWGITLKTVEIQDIKPSDTMQHAMEEQAAAERARRATVTRAGGEKAAAVLEAEGRLEASKRDAQAKVVLAEGTQRAIQKITEAVGENELPVMYLLGEKYVEALRALAESANAKLVLLPGDLPAALSAILNGKPKSV